MSTKKVFYIGAKAVKSDNVLNRKHLSWPGYGSHVVVPESDAEVYFRWPQVWVSEDDFKQLDAAKKATATVAVEVVTRSGDGSIQSESGDAGKVGAAAGNGDLNTEDRELLVQAAILQLKADDPKDYTAQGRPRIARVNEIAGTNVGADEIDAAFKALKHAGKVGAAAG